MGHDGRGRGGAAARNAIGPEPGPDDGARGGASAFEAIPRSAPGREVVVRTEFVVKRRGMVLECRHRLYAEANPGGAGDGAAHGRLLARATVTVMALRGSTRRPTSKLPQWVLDRLA